MATTIIEEVTEESLRDMANCIVRAVQPRVIYLFGSQASGDARPYSDVDIIVVVPDSLESRTDAYHDISMALMSFAFPIDTPVYRESDFDSRVTERNYFLSDCLSEARVLYEPFVPLHPCAAGHDRPIVQSYLKK